MEIKNTPSYPIKRRYQRRDLQIQIAILFQGHFAFDTCVSISEGGLLIQSNRILKSGDIVELSFIVPGGDFRIVNAEVVYIMDSDPSNRFIGMRFLNPPKKLLAEIRKFMRRKI